MAGIGAARLTDLKRRLLALSALLAAFVLSPPPGYSATDDTYLFNDEHFHLTNYVRKGPTARDALAILAARRTVCSWTWITRREMHINTEGICLWHSPVGGASIPVSFGGQGWLFNTDFIVTF